MACTFLSHLYSFSCAKWACTFLSHPSPLCAKWACTFLSHLYFCMCQLSTPIHFPPYYVLLWSILNLYLSFVCAVEGNVIWVQIISFFLIVLPHIRRTLTISAHGTWERVTKRPSVHSGRLCWAGHCVHMLGERGITVIREILFASGPHATARFGGRGNYALAYKAGWKVWRTVTQERNNIFQFWKRHCIKQKISYKIYKNEVIRAYIGGAGVFKSFSPIQIFL